MIVSPIKCCKLRMACSVIIVSSVCIVIASWYSIKKKSSFKLAKLTMVQVQE